MRILLGLSIENFLQVIMFGLKSIKMEREGGLWFHSGNSISGQSTPESKPIYFSSEEQFMEFCTKLIGIDHGEFETFWLKYG